MLIRFIVLSCILILPGAVSIAAEPELKKGSSLKDPLLEETQRNAAAAKALQTLSKQIHAARDGNPLNLVVEYSMAGLAFLSSGSTPTSGLYSKEIELCGKFVCQHTNAKGTSQAGGGQDLSTWGYAYAAIFLSELYAKGHSPEVSVALASVSRELSARQTVNGGWCHGAAGPCSNGYSELNAVGNMCLLGLGLARTEGATVDETILKKGLQYLLDSGGADGGMNYSTDPNKNATAECGRTAASILAFFALHQDKHPYFSKMTEYFKNNIDKLEAGHATPCMHMFMGALASHVLGKKSWQIFWASNGKKLLDRQRADGTFEGAKGAAFNEQAMPIWMQAGVTLVLCLPQDKLQLFKLGKD